MKTIANKAQGVWKRVSDDEAYSTAGRQGWSYCPKSQWKDNVRSPKKEEKPKEKKKEEE